MKRRGRLLEDSASLRVYVRLATGAGEARPLGVLRELTDLSAFVAFRVRELLSEEVCKTSRIVGELGLELLDGDEWLIHGLDWKNNPSLPPYLLGVKGTLPIKIIEAIDL